ncbi:MAG TPA: flagellar biosynthesis protein FlgC [Desulfobacterales bacterium]|nr:flagellar biosynthesis protein FlgC [Desulfobacterales bacterium]
MISGISSGLSALRALTVKTNSIADNTANVNTDGFKKTRVTLHEGPAGGGTVSAYVQRLNTPGPKVYEQTPKGETLVEKSNVDLTEELPALQLNRRYFEANIKAIQTQDKMLGSLLKIV